MLERDVESRSKDHARRKGWLARKWSSPGSNGVPDDLFFKEPHRLLIVEFKATGKKPSKRQKHEHDLLHKEGFITFVIDDVDDFKLLLAEYEKLRSDPDRVSHLPDHLKVFVSEGIIDRREF